MVFFTSQDVYSSNVYRLVLDRGNMSLVTSPLGGDTQSFRAYPQTLMDYNITLQVLNSSRLDINDTKNWSIGLNLHSE